MKTDQFLFERLEKLRKDGKQEKVKVTAAAPAG